MKSVNGENSEKLERQILATIAYYDILNYPLTSFEVFLYLINDEKKLETGNWKLDNDDINCQLLFSICDLLDSSEYLEKHIGQKLGFYYLKDYREDANRLHSPEGTMDPADKPVNNLDIVQRRLDGRKMTDEKWKKAKKIYKIMQAVPFLRGILISGSLALGSVKKSSDIDIMVIAKNGRIWTVRVFLTVLIFLLGVRRNEKDTKDKICLNHYITDKSLRIPFFSLYDAHLYSHLINVYDDKDSIKTFQDFQKNNSWIKNYVQNYNLSELKFSTSVKKNTALSLIAKFFECILFGKIGDYFEKTLSKIQIAKIKKNPSFNNKDGRITISDDQLEFHPQLHEKFVIPEFNKRMKELGLLEFANQKESGE
jgi:predicted nucleotidyltransferase